MTTKTFGRTRLPLTSEELDDPFVLLRDLPQLGVCYHEIYVRRLIRTERFPQPDRIGGRLAWRRSVIQAWIASKTEAA